MTSFFEYFVIYIIFSLFIRFFLSVTSISDKIRWVINLPKGKKYKNKVDPIYEMKSHFYDTSCYYVRKWSLKYVENELLSIIFLLIPYPIEFRTWKYDIDREYYLCEKKDINNIEGTLEEIFEFKDLKRKTKEEEDNRKKNESLSKVDLLNKIFNENYE